MFVYWTFFFHVIQSLGRDTERLRLGCLAFIQIYGTLYPPSHTQVYIQHCVGINQGLNSLVHVFFFVSRFFETVSQFVLIHFWINPHRPTSYCLCIKYERCIFLLPVSRVHALFHAQARLLLSSLSVCWLHCWGGRRYFPAVFLEETIDLLTFHTNIRNFLLNVCGWD